MEDTKRKEIFIYATTELFRALETGMRSVFCCSYLNCKLRGGEAVFLFCICQVLCTMGSWVTTWHSGNTDNNNNNNKFDTVNLRKAVQQLKEGTVCKGF